MLEYFLEDIIQLLHFQQINSNNRNKQLQDDDDNEEGYENSQADDIEIYFF
jgi:hypothetical protein